MADLELIFIPVRFRSMVKSVSRPHFGHVLTVDPGWMVTGMDTEAQNRQGSTTTSPSRRLPTTEPPHPGRRKHSTR